MHRAAMRSLRGRRPGRRVPAKGRTQRRDSFVRSAPIVRVTAPEDAVPEPIQCLRQMWETPYVWYFLKLFSPLVQLPSTWSTIGELEEALVVHEPMENLKLAETHACILRFLKRHRLILVSEFEKARLPPGRLRPCFYRCCGALC